MASKIEFPRGDGVTHRFNIPAANWTPGGKLFFAAKPAIDDDTTDSAQVIEGIFTDSNVTDVILIVSNVATAYKQYTCYFPPSATNSIVSDGSGKIDYLGEFQYIPANGIPVTFPYNDKKLDVVVYFDVKRNTAT